MDMRDLAKERLREYGAKLAARENLADEIRELAYRRQSLAGAGTDAPAVKSSGGGRENMLLSCIQRQAELEEALYLTQRWLKRVERGLQVLSPEERAVLDRLYLYPEKGAAERLAGELGVDVKTVYFRASGGLRKFTAAMFGSVEL